MKISNKTKFITLDGGNPIAVSLRHAGSILQVTLTNTVTGANFCRG